MNELFNNITAWREKVDSIGKSMIMAEKKVDFIGKRKSMERTAPGCSCTAYVHPDHPIPICSTATGEQKQKHCPRVRNWKRVKRSIWVSNNKKSRKLIDEDKHVFLLVSIFMNLIFFPPAQGPRAKQEHVLPTRLLDDWLSVRIQVETKVERQATTVCISKWESFTEFRLLHF